MNQRERRKISKFLSYILRHNPQAIDLELDRGGWAVVDQLLEKAVANGRSLTREQLLEVVDHDNKQRYSLRDDGRLIRANQGHSIPVDLGLEPLDPPPLLYHGTARRFLDSIMAQGLLAQNRHHVHLSADVVTALKVGQRHGRPLVLVVAARQMAEAGLIFYRSANGVWLTEQVDPLYLSLHEA